MGLLTIIVSCVAVNSRYFLLSIAPYKLNCNDFIHVSRSGSEKTFLSKNLFFVLHRFTDCDFKKNILAVASNAVGGECIIRNMIVPLFDLYIPVITKSLN